jgi:hypothetical protein
MGRYIITGGTGIVGKQLSKILLKNGQHVSLLSRRAGFEDAFFKYKWSISKQQIDTKWLLDTDTIVHLTGAGVADKKWTEAYKKEIYDSRILSTKLLFDTLKNNPHTIKTIVAASAIGIYGNDVKGIADENYPAADTFLAKVCKDWETEVNKFSELGIRVVIIRVGVVLSANGGFIKEVSKPIKMYAGAALGNGKQLMSWIHIDDLVNIFVKASKDSKMHGAYNAVAPTPISNQLITKKMAALLHKPLWLPNIPLFALKFLFGEMADMLVANQHISSQKIVDAGFQFEFPDIDLALADIFNEQF